MSTTRMPNGAEVILLQYLVNNDSSPEDLELKLFSNDLTYTETTDENDLTEATFTGYTGITLSGVDWTPSGGDPSSISHAQVTFESSADQTPEIIYGHYYVLSSSGSLIAVNKWDSEVTIQSDGDRVRVTPIIRAVDSGD